MELQLANEEFEQYGRRLCVRINGVPTIDNENSDKVLKVKFLFKETICDILDLALDRSQQVGKGYNDKKMFAVKVCTFNYF